MHVIQIAKTGGAEVLDYIELPIPKPDTGQVLIKIAAVGVNFIDTYLREGRYPSPLPFIPGVEAAGVVVEVGEGVTGFSEGDRVACSGVSGTYAEYACIAASKLVHVPAELSLEQAAAVLTQGMTAHYLAYDTYPIKSGDTVLIHAGAGGVGLLLVQMAKWLGATVISTVSTEDKAAITREAGADHVIVYTKQNFLEEVIRITGGAKLPVVYDSVGKTTFDDSLKCLRPLGLLVLYGAASGPVPPFDLMHLTAAGSVFLTRPTMYDYILTREALVKRADDVFGWVSSGKLKVRADHTYPLKEAAQAQRDLEGRKTAGKVLLIP